MKEFSELVELMAQLRGEQGCPWDRKQTVQAFKTFLLEEVYELIDAIEKEDYKELQEELGDVLFHIVFIARICEEKGVFNIKDVVTGISKKMYNRHPHVFLNASTEVPIELKWEDLKKEEKEEYALLSNIPAILPALLKAFIISRRVAKVGFDWPKIDDVYDKVSEELAELKEAEKAGDEKAIREEIGDLLFTVVNVARFDNVDPEDALRFACEKFIRRFSYVEENTDLRSSTLSTMETLWNNAKSIEKEGG